MIKLEAREESFGQTRQAVVNVYLPKIQIGKAAISTKREGLIYHRDPGKSWSKFLEPELHSVLAHNLSVRQNEPHKKIDVIVFPELSIPSAAIDDIAEWSSKTGIIVIAGSHYENIDGKWTSVSPVIIDGKIFKTYKLVPSPFENPGISGVGLHAGPYIQKFKGTRIGNFCVLICSDYLDSGARNAAIDENTHIVFVIACQKDVEKHYAQASVDIQQSQRGLYVAYSNLTFPSYGSGKSAALGLVHKDFEGHFKRLGYSDLLPKEKLWQSSSRFPSAVASFDMYERKPGLPKTTRTRSNVDIFMLADFHSQPIGKVKSAQETRAYKVVAFDFDGTLLRGNEFQYSWAAVWEKLWGDRDRLRWKSLMRDHLQKKITYKEWCDFAAADFRAKGIKLEQMIALAKEFKLVDNCIEVLGRLKAQGYKLVLISGGIDVFLKAHLSDLKNLFDAVHINELAFDMEGVVHSVKATSYDFDGKRIAIQEFCDAEGVGLDDVVYVGDSINDEALLGGEVGCFISVSKNEGDRVSRAANYHLLRDDLEDVYEIVARGKEQPGFEVS